MRVAGALWQTVLTAVPVGIPVDRHFWSTWLVFATLLALLVTWGLLRKKRRFGTGGPPRD